MAAAVSTMAPSRPCPPSLHGPSRLSRASAGAVPPPPPLLLSKERLVQQAAQVLCSQLQAAAPPFSLDDLHAPVSGDDADVLAEMFCKEEIRALCAATPTRASPQSAAPRSDGQAGEKRKSPPSPQSSAPRSDGQDGEKRKSRKSTPSPQPAAPRSDGQAGEKRKSRKSPPSPQSAAPRSDGQAGEKRKSRKSPPSPQPAAPRSDGQAGEKRKSPPSPQPAAPRSDGQVGEKRKSRKSPPSPSCASDAEENEAASPRPRPVKRDRTKRSRNRRRPSERRLRAWRKKIAARILRRRFSAPELSHGRTALGCRCLELELAGGGPCALHQYGPRPVDRAWMYSAQGRLPIVGGPGEVLVPTLSAGNSKATVVQYARWRRGVRMPTRFYCEQAQAQRGAAVAEPQP